MHIYINILNVCYMHSTVRNIKMYTHTPGRAYSLGGSRKIKDSKILWMVEVPPLHFWTKESKDPFW